MAKRSNSYWEDRAKQRMAEYHRDADVVVKTINAAYDKAQKDIQVEIDKIFSTFSTNGELVPEKAKKILNQKIPNPLFNMVKKLYPKIKNERIRKWLLVRINAPAYRARITRLEALKESIYLRSKELADVEISLNESSYLKTINSAYYRTMFDIQKGTGYGFEFAKMSDKTIKEILLNRWSGEHFSDRVWGNTDVLASQVTEVITAGFMSGVSNHKMIRELAERMNVGKFAASRLIRTETTYMANAAEMASYEEAEIEKYQFLATLDLRTSEQCRAKDLKVFKVSEATPGVNMPPLHPFCRSTTIAYFGEEELNNIQRRARNPVTGKSDLVPANMNYNEWYQTQIEKYGEEKIALEKKKHKNRSSDKKQYDNFKKILGKNAPSSFEEFIGMKYNSDEFKMFKVYASSIKTGELTPLADFDLYKKISSDIDKNMVNKVTANGIKITGKSNHFIARILGSVEQKRNGVPIENVLKALQEPIEIDPVKISSNGKSQRFRSDDCIVTINPDTGLLIQVNPYKNRRNRKND